MSTLKQLPPNLYFETDRVIIRPIALTDSHDFYELAQDGDIGPNAGWAPHQSHDETIEVLNRRLNRNNLSRIHTQPYINPYITTSTAPSFAVVLKENGKMIGSVGIKDTFSVPYEDVDMIATITQNDNFNDKRSSEGLKKALFHSFNLDKIPDELQQLYSKQLTMFEGGAKEDDNTNQITELNQIEPSSPKAQLCNALEINYALNKAYWGKGLISEAVKGLLEQYIWSYFTPQVILVTLMASNNNSRRVVEKLGGMLVMASKGALYRAFDDTTHDAEVFSILPSQE